MTATDLPVRVVTRPTSRTGRYVLLGAEPTRARRLWIALHGYGQLATRFARHFADALPEDTGMVIPEGLSRFYLDGPSPDGRHLQRVGATWMTREAREDDIADTLAWLDVVRTDVVRATHPPTVGVLAFSQGVATATRWLARSGMPVASFVAWAGSPAHDVDSAQMAARLQHTAVRFVCGDADPFFDDDQRETIVRTLRQWQPHATFLPFTGAHHLERTLLTTVLASLPHAGDAPVSPDPSPV